MLSPRMKALLLLAALLAVAGVVVAVAVASKRADPPAGTPDHGMIDDERCAHMPEHCERAGGAARG